MEIARPPRERDHRRMRRLASMSDERDEFPIIAANRHHRPARRVVDLDGDSVIVEAAKGVLGVALRVRRIGGGPIHASPHVAEQMKRLAAERIAAFAWMGQLSAIDTPSFSYPSRAC